MQSVIIATNRGRDTDCTAASAGALAGAVSGASSIPEEWKEVLESGIANNPYTSSHVTNKATAHGIYRALRSKVRRMQSEVAQMEEDSSGMLSEKGKKMKAYVGLMKEVGIIVP